MRNARERLSTTEIQQVRALVQERGLIPAAKAIDVSPQTLAKISADIPVSRATVTHTRAGLAAQR